MLSSSAPLPFPIETDQAASTTSATSTATSTCAGRARRRRIRVRSEISRIAREVMHRARVRRGRDPEPHPLDPRGRPRLRRPGPAAARQVVRAAAVAAAVQAAADDRRARAVLPDRPLLPGRGLPRRSAAGVHPARLRDELRRPRRRARHRRGRRPRAVAGAGLLRGARDPADDLPRGDGPVRVRQARPAFRRRADRADRLLRRHPVPGLPGALRGRGGHARRRFAAAAGVRRLAGLGEVARAPRAWPT